MNSKFLKTNEINLHFLDFAGENPPIILMHGVTANSHAFDGLVKAGINENNRFISVDLRGRGLSDKPEKGYSMENHARDILGLLDHLNIEKAILGGHSFGALLTIYMAHYYPERIEKLILIDAAAKLHPDVREMLIPAMSRLGKTFPSFAEYLEKMKSSPYLNFWDESMESYYKADVKENVDGTVTQRSSVENIFEALTSGSFGENWIDFIKSIKKPAILLNGSDNYGLDAPILPKEFALETVNMMADCKYQQIPGNHQTMIYGNGANEIVKAIRDFI